MKMKSREWHHPSVLRLLRETRSDDPLQAIRNKARHLVTTAFDRGWSGPPFDPVKLADLLKIDILPNDSVIDAQTIPLTGNRLRVEYNPHNRSSRISFSISHEIGHSLFPDCTDAIRHRYPVRTAESWELELLCDIAAAEILLPYAYFSNDAEKTPPNIPGILALAERYQASLEAVFLRYTDIVSVPSSMLIAFFNDQNPRNLIVQYSKNSSTFDLSIQRGYVIPRNSKAYECTASGWSSGGTEAWSIFRGSKLNVSAIGLPPIKYENNQRVGILLSPTSVIPLEPTRAIEYVFGDATKPRGKGVRIIAHIVNSGGALGMGFGRSLAHAWPQVTEILKSWKNQSVNFVLGRSNCEILDSNLYVFQMLAQKGVTSSPDSPGIRYSSLRECLETLSTKALELHGSVHMPRIGVGQAGGDWRIIEGMIHDTLVNRGIDVTIYDYPGKKASPRPRLQPDFFGLT